MKINIENIFSVKFFMLAPIDIIAMNNILY